MLHEILVCDSGFGNDCVDGYTNMSWNPFTTPRLSSSEISTYTNQHSRASRHWISTIRRPDKKQADDVVHYIDKTLWNDRPARVAAQIGVTDRYDCSPVLLHADAPRNQSKVGEALCKIRGVEKG